MMIQQFTLAVLFALAATNTPSVDAHGKLLKPEAKVRPDSNVGVGAQFDFVGEIDSKMAFPQAAARLQWRRSPQQNQAQFAEQFTAAGYTSLRQFFQANDQLMVPRFRGRTDNVCGFTDPAAAPSTLPADGVIEWGNNVGRWGFQNNHHGPCEIWCDNNLVMQNNDCRSAFGRELPARMQIDMSRCSGASRLQFLWLAVHFAKWQYWLNCVPLAATAAPPVAIPTANISAPGAQTAAVPVALPQVVPGAAAVPVAPAVVPAAVPVYAPGAVPPKAALGDSPQRQGEFNAGNVANDADIGSVAAPPAATGNVGGVQGLLDSLLSRARGA